MAVSLHNIDQILGHTQTTKSGCLVWIGSCQLSGRQRNVPYPSIRHGSKIWRGNRLVWTLVNGEIPKGICVLHRCDNTKCLNPEHLFLGTHSDNMQDKIQKGRDHNKKKTHCRNGHPFSGENLIIRIWDNNKRACRICMRSHWRKHDALRRPGKRG